eukprot:COSAG06_NODE_6311_length_2989_cov_8.844983_5_plen_95_part_01
MIKFIFKVYAQRCISAAAVAWLPAPTSALHSIVSTSLFAKFSSIITFSLSPLRSAANKTAARPLASVTPMRCCQCFAHDIADHPHKSADSLIPFA